MERHKTIAAHYRFIFRQLFDCFGFPKVIVLEVGLQLVLSDITHHSFQVQPKYMRAHRAHLLCLSTAACLVLWFHLDVAAIWDQVSCAY